MKDDVASQSTKTGYLMTRHRGLVKTLRHGKSQLLIIIGFSLGVNYANLGVSTTFFGIYPPDSISGIRLKTVFWRVLAESGGHAIVCLHCALPNPV